MASLEILECHTEEERRSGYELVTTRLSVVANNETSVVVNLHQSGDEPITLEVLDGEGKEVLFQKCWPNGWEDLG